METVAASRGQLGSGIKRSSTLGQAGSAIKRSSTLGQAGSAIKACNAFQNPRARPCPPCRTCTAACSGSCSCSTRLCSRMGRMLEDTSTAFAK